MTSPPSQQRTSPVSSGPQPQPGRTIAGTSLVLLADDTDASRQREVEVLAYQLALPVINPGELPTGDCDLALRMGDRGLELIDLHAEPSRPFRVDFLAGSTGYRMRTMAKGRQLLARAIGPRTAGTAVVDATAGFGTDAFALAVLGCNVTAVERSPVIAALLRDALDRAAADPQGKLAPAVRRLRLVVADARDFLLRLDRDEVPDVIFIDPMFPQRSKTALQRKQMRLCRLLAGEDSDASELLGAARGIARRRVVVKRHRYAAPLGPDRSVEYLGRTVRYDVYKPLPATTPH